MSQNDEGTRHSVTSLFLRNIKSPPNILLIKPTTKLLICSSSGLYWLFLVTLHGQGGMT